MGNCVAPRIMGRRFGRFHRFLAGSDMEHWRLGFKIRSSFKRTFVFKGKKNYNEDGGTARSVPFGWIGVGLAVRYQRFFFVNAMKRFFNIKKPIRSFFQKGFSLVELLVTISIFAILTVIILTQNAQFNGTILLNNLAFDVALSVRQAQVYGLSVRQSTSSTPFDVGYGVNFDITNPTSYILFADGNNNSRYDTSPSEALNVFTVNHADKISSLCGTDSAGAQTCSSGGVLTRLTIVFKRPNLDAQISSNVAGGVYQTATITVSSPNNNTRTVSIASTGQISVNPSGS
jgi:prepilin-type N-terminal cleavage/methylation domain-containing protein